jgi:hypothetical protein
MYEIKVPIQSPFFGMNQAEKCNEQGVESGRYSQQYPQRTDQSTNAIVIIIVTVILLKTSGTTHGHMVQTKHGRINPLNTKRRLL